jgi:hypothetical protein
VLTVVVVCRRTLWQDNFKSVSYPLGGSQADDDFVVSCHLTFGYLMNLVMFGDSGGGDLTTKMMKRWDTPTKGAVTYAIIPWLVKENAVDEQHSLLSIKTGTMQPHPHDPRKVLHTTVEINTMGRMPTWALNWMVRSTAPSLIKTMEEQYIANIRKKGLTTDVMPKPAKVD